MLALEPPRDGVFLARAVLFQNRGIPRRELDDTFEHPVGRRIRCRVDGPQEGDDRVHQDGVEILGEDRRVAGIRHVGAPAATEPVMRDRRGAVHSYWTYSVQGEVPRVVVRSRQVRLAAP